MPKLTVNLLAFKNIELYVFAGHTIGQCSFI